MKMNLVLSLFHILTKTPTFISLKIGTNVNLEFDVVGKYVAKLIRY